MKSNETPVERTDAWTTKRDVSLARWLLGYIAMVTDAALNLLKVPPTDSTYSHCISVSYSRLCGAASCCSFQFLLFVLWMIMRFKRSVKSVVSDPDLTTIRSSRCSSTIISCGTMHWQGARRDVSPFYFSKNPITIYRKYWLFLLVNCSRPSFPRRENQHSAYGLWLIRKTR